MSRNLLFEDCFARIVALHRGHHTVCGRATQKGTETKQAGLRAVYIEGNGRIVRLFDNIVRLFDNIVLLFALFLIGLLFFGGVE